jgi:hypothetical protein
VLPGENYEITGTCCENPEPADDHDRNRIAKGEHEHTFLISSKPEQQLESGLRRNAMLMIFGGAALTLVCLALLMARYKLF